MGALRSLRRRREHGKPHIGDSLNYPPRRMFFCDCGEHFPRADEMSAHATECPSIPPGGAYPAGEARVQRFEAICKRLKTPFRHFIMMLSLMEASFVPDEMSDQELGEFISMVYAQYGVEAEDFA